MTEQEAQNLLHARLPAGSTVTLSQHVYCQTTVNGGGPVAYLPRCNWYVAVTVREGTDVTQGEFAYTLQEAVEGLLSRLPAIVAESRSGGSTPPPLLTAPSSSPSQEREERRNAS